MRDFELINAKVMENTRLYKYDNICKEPPDFLTVSTASVYSYILFIVKNNNTYASYS